MAPASPALAWPHASYRPLRRTWITILLPAWVRLDLVVRRLAPQIRTALIEAALQRRARTNLRLALAADDPADRLLGTLWQVSQPRIVHWEVGGDSPASPEDAAFAACGRYPGISMRDTRWQHGTEKSHPVTCEHCMALLQAAKS
jgi:hypothetical protein